MIKSLSHPFEWTDEGLKTLPKTRGKQFLCLFIIDIGDKQDKSILGRHVVGG